jgi:hypothetical protein
MISSAAVPFRISSRTKSEAALAELREKGLG